MNLRETALAAYYYTSLPLRWWWRTPETAPVGILFYHRVADKHPNEWTMSTATFQRQMDYLQEHYELVTLPQAQQLMRGESVTERPAVCITFDDGYGENVDFALPLIIDRNIPCTYFVTHHHVTTGAPFSHDVAAGVPLPTNTIAELRDMVEAGIEIGGHTRTHPDLATITDEAQLYDEVIVAGAALAEAIGQPLRYFAFPFGLHANLVPLAFAMAKSAGYEAVVSAYGGYNFRGDDTFHLQRFHADPIMIRFKNYLALDPRIVRKVKRFEYQSAEAYRAYLAASPSAVTCGEEFDSSPSKPK